MFPRVVAFVRKTTDCTIIKPLHVRINDTVPNVMTSEVSHPSRILLLLTLAVLAPLAQAQRIERLGPSVGPQSQSQSMKAVAKDPPDTETTRVVKELRSVERSADLQQPALNAATPLTPGRAVTFRLGPVDNMTLFRGDGSFQLEVTDSATRVTVTLESTDDMGLYVRYEEDNDVQDGRVVSDYSSDRVVAGTEEIVITGGSDPPLRAGTYFISIVLFATGVEAEGTLTATLDGDDTPPPSVAGGPLTPGQPSTFRLGPRDNTTLFTGGLSFRLEVPDTATRVTVTLESVDPDVNVNLFVRFGEDNALQDGRVVSDYSSLGPTGNEQIVITPNSDPPLRAGTYFVSLGLRDIGVVAEGTLTATVETVETMETEPESFEIPNLGGWSVTSSGTESAMRSGYGRIRAEAGSTTPSGIAIFGFRQGGVLVAEAGVPATEAVQEGRIFAEVNDPVNTGLAIANPNDAPATIAFYFRDAEGERFGDGQFELGAHEQTAKFLNDAPFNSGELDSGTFTFTSSVPIAVIALRGLTNRDGEFLMTTLPVAPLAAPRTPFSGNTGSADTVYFPHFTDGNGWVTQVILVNPTDRPITGTVRFLGPGSGAMAAAPAVLTLDDDRTGSEFPYSIPAGSSQRFTTSNPSGRVTSGSVRATPNPGSVAPSGLVVFSYTTGGKTVSESGVPALPAGSAFRVYAESSGTPNQAGSIRTGLAITNAADTTNMVTLEMTGLDGNLAMGVAPVTLPLPPSGQVARFLDEIFDSLPNNFSGVLRVTSTADVAIVGLRLRINARGELKMTTTPPSNETDPPTTADRFFPHIVDSAGWSTQFILFSGTAGQTSPGTLSFIDTAGELWDLPTRDSSSGGAEVMQLAFSDGTSATRVIPENIPPRINVGAPVSAVGGDALKYAISGTDARSFVIVPDTGQIRTREGVTYDYETKNRYSVTVGVEDDGGNRDTIDVTIRIVNLAPACEPPSNFRVNYSDERLTLRWSPLSDITGRARVLGYETEIRRGTSGAWTDRRTFLGRNIGSMIYAGLDNEIGYQVRVRPINAEGDCGWSTPVSGIPTADRAPEDDDDYHDRFGPHPVGTPERNLRLLTPGRCRHTSNGQTLDADCEYENTGPDSGRIFLEFDDPSQGSCEITLAYSSLTAGSFIDECFDAGVNTNVPFDRSFRMPRLAPGTEDDLDPPTPETTPQRAPRTQEEFDALVFGRDDFIPGLCFGSCIFGDPPEKGVARVFSFDEDGVAVSYGDYTYEKTGPSQGVVTLTTGGGGVWTFTLDFEPWGNVRATIVDSEGGTAVWPGTPYVDLALGAQPVLLPIPPSWSAAIAVEADYARVESHASDIENELLKRFFTDLNNLVSGDGGINHRRERAGLGRNRFAFVVSFPRLDTNQVYGGNSNRKLDLNGSEWTFVVTITSDGGAEFSLTVTKEGELPLTGEGFVDFTGAGINVDEFPEELLLPDDPPQASGEDVSGVEVAAAITTTRIGGDDVQTFLVSDSGATYRPGDWLEPKDGSNQRMMIVGASQVSAVASAALSPDASPQFDPQILKTQTAVSSPGSPLFAAAMAPFGVKASPAAALTSSSTITQLSVVCMQIGQDIPTRGARYFSQPKTAQDPVQLCQQRCVLDGMGNIQACVWSCEANAAGN